MAREQGAPLAGPKPDRLPIKLVKCHAHKWAVYDLTGIFVGFVRKRKYPYWLHGPDVFYAEMVESNEWDRKLRRFPSHYVGQEHADKMSAAKELVDRYVFPVHCKHLASSWSGQCEHEQCKHGEVPKECMRCVDEWVEEAVEMYWREAR